jgi:DNA-binding response OmpR family regulator
MISRATSGWSDPLARTGVIRLLHVEDDADTAALVARRLRWCLSARFQVTHVRSLDEALVRIERGGCDVLLLDLGLPDSDGVATITSACAIARHVPIVVLTSDDSEDMAAFALRAGAAAYLVKQRLDRRSLVVAVTRALEGGASGATSALERGGASESG